MNEEKCFRCTICGHSKQPREEFWYLLVENKWEDTLKILQWDNRLAGQAGVHRTCSASHLEELVVHWMVTGRVDYPFAQLSVGPGGDLQMRQVSPFLPLVPDTSGVRQIGELAVHRESLCRVMAENPQSLKTILQALLNALEQDKPLRENRASEKAVACALI